VNTIVSLLFLVLLLPDASWAEDDASAHLALRTGLRIKAKGTFAEGRLLVAESVRRKDAGDDDVELSGRISEMDAATGAFRVLGAWVLADEDELNRRQRRVAESLAPGDWVKVEGELQKGDVLVADSVGKLRKSKRVEAVEGVIHEVGPVAAKRRLRVGPVDVQLTETTEMRGL
jgi:hypothetical protein